MTEPKCLLAVDVDRVQDYVYESARLPEVRGASALLDWLGERLGDLLRDPYIDFTAELSTALDPYEGVTIPGSGPPPTPILAVPGIAPRVADRAQPSLRRLQAIWRQPGFSGAEVVYAAGGSLLAIVPAAQAEDIGECLTDLYTAVTLVATATYATVPYDPTRFQHCYRVLGRELRRRKDSAPGSTAERFLAGARQLRCSSCDLRASIGEFTHEHSSEETERRPICAACRIKIQARGLPRMAGRLRDVVVELGKEWGGWYDFARDLEEIGRRCCPASVSGGREYIAAIYMDGDGMGSRVESEATSAENLREFSRKLGQAMQEAVLRTLARRLPPERDKWPFQIIYIGGDDLFLLVPADVALDVAKEIRDRFAGAMSDLTLSAGVVMCHPQYPVYFLHRMAKALCANAKRKGGDRVDFEILRSGSVVATEPGELRKRITAVEGDGTSRVERRSLTMRPYQWDDLAGVLEAYRSLRSVGYPKGQLIVLASEALKGRLEASSLYVYQVARAREGQVDALKQIAERLGAVAPPPWKMDDTRSHDGRQVRGYSTILGDLVEMYGVVDDGGAK